MDLIMRSLTTTQKRLLGELWKKTYLHMISRQYFVETQLLKTISGAYKLNKALFPPTGACFPHFVQIYFFCLDVFLTKMYLTHQKLSYKVFTFTPLLTKAQAISWLLWFWSKSHPKKPVLFQYFVMEFAKQAYHQYDYLMIFFINDQVIM